jgi:putative FmdB family regulatory protein
MPIFEFTCRDCGQNFEDLMSFAQMQAGEAVCPGCGSRQVERGLSAFATGGGGAPGAPPCGDSGGRGCGGAFT